MLACVCVCEHVQYRRVHSCTCLFLCHIREPLGVSAEGGGGAGDCGEGGSVDAMRITAVFGMAAHFNACLSGPLNAEPVLACWSLSTNTKYHTKSFSAPVKLMRSAC